jgi:hypothetical protein
MGDIVPFPVLTLGELESPRGWSAALNMPLPRNPSIGLLDAAIRELLNYQCAVLCDASPYGMTFAEEQESRLISRRLREIYAEIRRWHRWQKIRLGEGMEV